MGLAQTYHFGLLPGWDLDCTTISSADIFAILLRSGVQQLPRDTNKSVELNSACIREVYHDILDRNSMAFDSRLELLGVGIVHLIDCTAGRLPPTPYIPRLRTHRVPPYYAYSRGSTEPFARALTRAPTSILRPPVEPRGPYLLRSNIQHLGE